ncbi:unnamed protein product [Lupinus luteus]|uniref:Peptidase A1 domain-containing protein n=1 Tax=Lupinus luteus TaxID=3873 RepID=A0AAV1WLX4_LUPLU
MANALHRSSERVKHFYPKDVATNRVIQTRSTNIRGEYVMKFSIGTPKFDVMAIADLGSDLIWVQCQPCKNCYKQIDPIFMPSKSKTYKAASCSSRACKLIKQSNCKKNAISLTCQYKIKYMDESGSSGDVSEETFTFGTKIKNTPTEIKNIVFGCGHDNQGDFHRKITGVVGLGNGPASLTSQLGVEKFSYCLPEKINFPTLLNFGEKAVVSGPGTVSTPLLLSNSDDYYGLNLQGISVAGKRINIFDDDGNAGSVILLDTAPMGKKLCYKSSPSGLRSPPITVHLAGADIVLNKHNTFGLVDDLMCFKFDIDDNISVLGNTLQINFLIGIDKQKKVVSFKPTTCSMLQS